jgi:hypothetical protein
MFNLLRLMMVLLCLGPVGVQAGEVETSEEVVSTQVEEVQPAADLHAHVESMVSNLLKAYNDQDPTAFYADFAESMASITTPEAFKALYTDTYMADLGSFVSKEINQEETVLGSGSPVGLVVYRATFENSADVKISVNLIMEGSAWKVMQVQFMRESRE